FQIITLCVLIEMTAIQAKTERLPATKSNTNQAKLLVFHPLHPTLMPTISSRSTESLYNYNYNTDTGIQAQEHGHLNNVGTDQEAIEVRGSYSYNDNEQNTFQVSYVANENGFQPEGAHLPEIPPLIKKALQYIAEHPEENGE
ncbi:larval cuticle protein 65Ag1-like, partial [Cataglyphis hispanica]|uniref:larval cuticle protein 65Ag1-like n=1 Tax=Cataglyphis hispanica TaxID=1086592 RepID=UPI0021806C79